MRTATRSPPKHVTRTKQVMGIPDEPFWSPAELGRRVPAALRPSAAHPSEVDVAGSTRHGRPRRRGMGRVLAAHRHRRIGIDALPDVRAGREHRHPRRHREGVQRHARRGARLAGRRCRPHRQHRHQAHRPGARSPLEHPGGRQMYYGVREHAMGSAMVGMAMHGGVLPAGGTFFVFLDYMRPSGPPRQPQPRQGRVRLHPRLGRRRRGRADAPAGRAARHAAGDSRPAGHPAGRRQRDRRRVAGACVDHDGPTALVLSPAGDPGVHRRHGRRARRRRRARGRRPAGGPRRHRQRGGAVRRRRRSGSAPTGVRASSSACRRGIASPRQDPNFQDVVFPAGVPVLSVEAATTFGWERYADRLDRHRPLRRQRSRCSRARPAGHQRRPRRQHCARTAVHGEGQI